MDHLFAKAEEVISGSFPAIIALKQHAGQGIMGIPVKRILVRNTIKR